MQINSLIQEGAECVWRGTKHSALPLALETVHLTCSALQEQPACCPNPEQQWSTSMASAATPLRCLPGRSAHMQAGLDSAGTLAV